MLDKRPCAEEQATVDVVKALKAGREAANIGREILRDYFGRLKSVSEKKQMGLVSEADVASEKAISTFLQREFPDVEILGEESTFARYGDKTPGPRDGTRWIIDPLDGTTNYVHRFPIYCISIGLEHEGEIICGIIDVPVLNRTYYATKGGGAFVNDEPIRVSDRKDMSELLLATGFSTQDKNILSKQLAIFSQMINRVRGVRRAGSAAYDMCMVAEGIFDGYWEMGLQPWDTAGGTVLVREAGGIVTDFAGTPYSPYMNTVLASNALAHDELRETIFKSCQKNPTP